MNAKRRLLSFMLRVLLCAGFLPAAIGAHAQSYTPGYPPTFSTIPANPPAWQPFQISIRAYALSPAVGPMNVNANGREITVFFDYGCGFICPGSGGPYYHAYPMAMPPMAPGTYTLRFIAANEPAEIYSFDIGGASTPISAPATGFASLTILSLLLLLAARLRGGRAVCSRSGEYI